MTSLAQLFREPPPSSSRWFRNLARKRKDVGETRRWLLNLWDEFRPLADKNFLIEFPRETIRRFWELYLGCYLSRRFPSISRSIGADFRVSLGPRTLFIEATAPDPGHGEDAVPEMVPDGEMHEVPHEKMALRFAQAISTKYRNFIDHREKGRIRESDPFVIAVNEYPLLNGWMASNRDLPLAGRALASFGSMAIVYDTKSFKRVDSYHTFVPAIAKQTRNKVRMDYFLSDEFSALSAVLVSRVTPFPAHEQLGRDFLILHNPFAKNPIGDDLFAGTRQMNIEFIDGRTRLKDIERPAQWND